MSTAAAAVKADSNTQLADPKATKPTSIKGWLESPGFREEVSKALPKHLTPDRQIRVAITALNRTPALAQCSPASFLRCMLDLSAAGLEPDGRRAHLIPYRNNKTGGYDCQLIIDYKGLVELAMRSGTVSNIHADAVCDKDTFEADTGRVRHVVNYREPRGPVYAVYAVVRFKDGGEKVEVMTRDEVEAIRKRSRAGGSGPWVTDWNEMAKKTVARRALKWVPLSPEIREAVEKDDDAIDIKATPVRPQGGLSALIDGNHPQEAGPDAPTATPEAGVESAHEPVAAGKEYTPQDREAIVARLEAAMFDAELTEAALWKQANADKLVSEGIDELWNLPTAALDALLTNITAKSAKKGGAK